MSIELRVFERGSGSAKKKHLMFKVDGSAMGLKKALPVLGWTDHSGDRYVSWESELSQFLNPVHTYVGACTCPLEAALTNLSV